jgi:hypothetical protein
MKIVLTSFVLGLCMIVQALAHAPPAVPSDPAFDGRALYQAAFEMVRDKHLNLLDEGKRQQFVAQWENKFATGDQLTTEAGTDAAIHEMLASQGIRFDRYFTPSQTAAPNTLASEQVVMVTRRSDGVAVITIKHFLPEDFEHQFEEALKQVADAKAIVFDLRDNAGGRTDAGVNAVSMLMSDGKVNVTVRREGNTSTRDEVAIKGPFYMIGKFRTGFGMRTPLPRPAQLIADDVKLAVLVNGKSASASEIFAGALQVNKRAVIVGEKSHGKGVGQEIFDLPFNRRIWITTFEFRAGGVPHNGIGITPDHLVSKTGSGDAQLEEGVRAVLK